VRDLFPTSGHFNHEVTTQTEVLRRQIDYATAEVTSIASRTQPFQAEIAELEAKLSSATSTKDQDAIQKSISHQQRQIDQLREPADEMEFLLKLWQQIQQFAQAAHDNSTAFPLGRLARTTREWREKENKFREKRRKDGLGRTYPAPEVYAAPVQDFRASISRVLDLFSLDSLLRKVPIVYQQFRLANWEELGFFLGSSLPAVNERKIDSLELDTLIFAALSVVRDAHDGGQVLQESGDSVSQKLLNEMRLVVAVDEASDFSATELGCMALLAHPRFNSVTLSGDLMQRMTQHGIADWGELELLHTKPEIFDLKISYRQSPRLLRIAGELWQKTFGTPPPFASAFCDSGDEPDALRFVEGKKRIRLWKRWLLKDRAHRVIEQAKAEVARSLDKEKAEKEIAYLENNGQRMTYGTFRRAGYFIGSGVVEAGCKTVGMPSILGGAPRAPRNSIRTGSLAARSRIAQ